MRTLLLITLITAAPTAIAAPAIEVFEKVCARCHETGIGPVITGRDLPVATYIIIARSGRNAMPAFRVTDIDDQTLLELAEYLAATPPPPETAHADH
ncbi:c-type cytochrome [Marichromatium bheemlicum]|uniref:Cytochrome c n=1 Tax=Marichromatium bheemlicum TaxID=365339 RepID=A0ABX1I8B5_9GAMM|nr:cytochrome c [Marichromatium bheemlicum]NKN32472.1 cytochrome c [Marichromatium bheemlicum]